MREPTPEEIEALAMGALESVAKKRKTVLKGIVGQRYDDGSRETFRSPVGAHGKLGMIFRTDPEPSWQVTDSAALDDYLRTFDGCLVITWDIVDHDVAVEVLKEHAPHLLAEVTKVDPAAVKAAVAESRDKGEAVAPGIALVKPAGELTVKPDPAAFEEFGRMVRAGALTWDFRPALEPGDEQEQAS